MWNYMKTSAVDFMNRSGYKLSGLLDLPDSGADLGYTIGTYHMQLPDGDGNVVEIEGKYLSVWKRQPDGRWKIAVDMFNSNGPPVPVVE